MSRKFTLIVGGFELIFGTWRLLYHADLGAIAWMLGGSFILGTWWRQATTASLDELKDKLMKLYSQIIAKQAEQLEKHYYEGDWWKDQD